MLNGPTWGWWTASRPLGSRSVGGRHPRPQSGGGPAPWDRSTASLLAVVDQAPDEPHRSGLIGGVVGRVAPVVMRQIDTNDLVDALDVNVIAASLDLDALLERIDIDQVAERLDLDALLKRLDIDEIAARLDLDALLLRIDVDRIADRLDLDALLLRIDVDQIADRLDLDALLDRIDVDQIAGRLDLEALIERIDMAKITAGASQDVAISGLDLVRRQIVRADATVDGIVGRVLRRRTDSRPEAPGHLSGVAADVVAAEADPHELQRRDVSGHYAGPVTRALSVLADVSAVFALNTVLVALTTFFLGTILDVDPSQEAVAVLTLSSLAVLFTAWFWLPVAFLGRTPAMALLGIAVVCRDGTVASGVRALVRALVLPVSLVVPVLFIGLVVGKERRTFHDLIAGTTVVYDWGAREAEQPVTIREQFSARVRRREIQRDPDAEPAVPG